MRWASAFGQLDILGQEAKWRLLPLKVDRRFMYDRERLAVEKAAVGDLTDIQILLLEYCNSLRHRLAVDIPADLRRLLAVEDVLQEVCVEAIRDIAKFEWRGRGSFQSWLNEVARTCLLDLVRSYRRRKRAGHAVRLRLSWVEVAEHAVASADYPGVTDVAPNH